MRTRVRIFLLVLSFLFALSFLASPAVAHPLGNFTVNLYGGLRISTDRVMVHHVVDMAEIPTLQAKDSISPDENVSRQELESYARAVASGFLRGISITADGDRLQLSVAATSAELLPGEGGLEVLRIESVFSGPLPSPRAVLAYEDRNFARSIGWREIVATVRGGQGIVSSSVPGTSRSDVLTNYPSDLLSSPLDQKTARIEVAPGAGAAPQGEGSGGAVGDEADGTSAAFLGLVERDLSAGFLLVALALAFGTGALHALGPGHGKTIMAVYLVGAQGKVRHALAIGAAVSLMHTLSVVALGLITLFASSLFPPEAVYPWLAFSSGAIVLALGLWLLRLRIAGRRRRLHGAHEHDHVYAHEHDHGHEHHDEHTHGRQPHTHGGTTHTHALPEDASPLSWKGLGAIALSGGLLPSPTALIVLLGAISLHRVAYGLVLVAAFSVGLASALSLIGIAVLRARSFAARRFGRAFGTAAPLLSAVAISTVGLVLTLQAAVRL